MEEKIIKKRKKRYFFLTALLFAIAFITIFIPEKQNREQIGPEELLAELNDETRFFTTDEIAEKIIMEDPSLQLIDVRSAEEFEEYSLPGAINIPIENILDAKWTEYLKQDVKTNVFYSNGTIYSSQAWLIIRRLDYKNSYVLKGGLNEWFSTIIMPKAPSSVEDDHAIDVYQFRKGASLFFGGAKGAVSDDTNEEPKKAAPVKKKTSHVEEEGGC